MVNSHGRFVWYELMTTDIETAKAFYANVVETCAFAQPHQIRISLPNDIEHGGRLVLALWSCAFVNVKTQYFHNFPFDVRGYQRPGRMAQKRPS
jgi:hypothetical protein